MRRFITLTTSAMMVAAMAISSVFAASSGGGNSAASTAVKGYPAAQAAVAAGQYAQAINILADVVKTDGKNADAWNLLGYSSRKLGHYDNAAKYYEAALRLDPDHLGALEYQGELFIETGQLVKARANLAQLRELCGTCEEYRDLQEAVGIGY